MRGKKCSAGGSGGSGCGSIAMALGALIIVAVICPWQVLLLIAGLALVIAGIYIYRR